MVPTTIKVSDILSRGTIIVGGGLHLKFANGKVKMHLFNDLFVGWVYTTSQPYQSQPLFYENLLFSHGGFLYWAHII